MGALAALRQWTLALPPTSVQLAFAFGPSFADDARVTAAVAGLRENAARCEVAGTVAFTLQPDGRATDVRLPQGTAEARDCLERAVPDWDPEVAVRQPTPVTFSVISRPGPRAR